MTALASRIGNSLPLIAGAILVLVLAIAGMALMSARDAGPDMSDPEVQRELAEAHEAAHFYISSDQLPEARVILEELLEKFPDDAKGHILMATLLAADDEVPVSEAYHYASRSVELDDSDHEAQFFTGLMADANDDHEQAMHHYARATELAPQVGAYAMYYAQSLMRAERFDEADVQLDRAKRLDANLHQTYAMQAEIAAQRGEIEQALNHVDKALDLLDPRERHYVNYSLQKAELLRRVGNAEAAQAVLMELTPAQQQEPRVVEQIAQGHLMLERPDRAAAVWAELFALEPTNARAAAEAGLAFIEADRPNHAQQYYEFARAVSTSDEKVLALQEALSRAN